MMDPPLRVKAEYSVMGKKKKKEVQKVIQDLVANFSDSSDDESANPKYPVTSFCNQTKNAVQQKSNQAEESVGKNKDTGSAMSSSGICFTTERKSYKSQPAMVMPKLEQKDFLYTVCSDGKENVPSLNQNCAKEMKISKHSLLQEGLNEKNKTVEQSPEDRCTIAASNDNKNRVAESQNDNKEMKITRYVKKQGEKTIPDDAWQPQTKPKSRKGNHASKRTLADLGISLINFDFSDAADSEVTEKPLKVNGNPQLLTPSDAKSPCSYTSKKECKLKEQKIEMSADKLSVDCDHPPEKLPVHRSKCFPTEIISTSVGKICTPLAWHKSLNDGQILKIESEMTYGVATCSKGSSSTRTSTPCHPDTEHRVSDRCHLSVSEIGASDKFKPCVSDSRGECEINLTLAKSTLNTKTMSFCGASSSEAGLAEESIFPFLESMPANLLESTSFDPKQNFRMYLAEEWNKAEAHESIDQDGHSKKKHQSFHKSEEVSSDSLSKSNSERLQATEISDCRQEKDELNDGGSSQIRNISGINVPALSIQLQFQSLGEVKNETESQYETCQSSAEKMSFYEAMDVSTQTSFLWEATRCQGDFKHRDVDEFEEPKHNVTGGSVELFSPESDIIKIRQNEVPVLNMSDTCSDSALYITTESADDKDIMTVSTSENLLDESCQEQTTTKRESFQIPKQELGKTAQLASDSDLTQRENGAIGMLDVQKKVSAASTHSPGGIIDFGIGSQSDSVEDELLQKAVHDVQDTNGSDISELASKSGMQVTNDPFATSTTDAEDFEHIRKSHSGWRRKKDVSSSDEDADELLEGCENNKGLLYSTNSPSGLTELTKTGKDTTSYSTPGQQNPDTLYNYQPYTDFCSHTHTLSTSHSTAKQNQSASMKSKEKEHRPQVEQTTYSDSDSDYDDMDNFIVNDSDVSESEEECYAHLHDLEFSEPLLGKFQPKDKKKLGDCSYSDIVASSESECSEVDGKREFIDKDADTSSEECNEVFSTPLPVIKSKSCSRTPSNKVCSPQWFTPATSTKSKSRHGRANKNFPEEAVKTGSTISSFSGTQNSASNQIGVKNAGTARHLSFLRSLSTETPDSLRHPEAKSLVSQFRKRREELSSQLFKLFNYTVFENKLPDSMQIIWNKRLLKTAGRCRQKRVGGHHHACIELSLKVCDTPERVRDTLIHEMCHAAVWLVNERNEGHGPLWRYWARRANKSHPDIPAIGRCHNYKISTKYIYKCNKCDQQVGRHSKSLDTSRFICGRCGGRFQLFVESEPGDSSRCGQPPRTPNRFAMFVKENYGTIKKGNKDISHKEIMNMLSKDFSEKNKI